MKKCLKCGNPVEDGMIICPSCGEQLRDPKEQNKFEFVSIHLIRWLMVLSLTLPFIGIIVAFSIRKKYPLISKAVRKFSLFGVLVYLLILLLAMICYIAMTFTGVSFF